MSFYFSFFYLIYIFHRINSFLILSMNVLAVDDCIRKIELDNGTNLFEKNDGSCWGTDHGEGYNSPIFDPIPYDIGQKIKIVIGDVLGICYLKMNIFINSKTLKNDDINFWSCDNCGDYFNFYDNKLYCFSPSSTREKNDYNFYFYINSLEQLDFKTSEYLYYLNCTNDIYISSSDSDNEINLIDLYSLNNLYAKNSEGNIITPFYKYIYYKLSFDDFKTHEGKFIGSDDSNNDIELDENTYSRILENKNLRYVLSNEEKNYGRAYLRFKIGIYNNQKKLISKLKDIIIHISLQNNQPNEMTDPLTLKEIEEIKKAQEIKQQDKILENFEKGFTSENYDTSELEKGNDAVTKTEKMTITLTTTDNQKSNVKNDTSSKVDLGPCEDILRSVYNISKDKKLL